MQKMIGVWAWLAATLVLLSACARTLPASPEAALPLPTGLPTGTPLVTATLPAEQTDVPIQATETITAATLVPGRPTAPSGVDDGFRPDPASVFAATGRPQFVEFFAFW